MYSLEIRRTYLTRATKRSARTTTPARSGGSGLRPEEWKITRPAIPATAAPASGGMRPIRVGCARKTISSPGCRCCSTPMSRSSSRDPIAPESPRRNAFHYNARDAATPGRVLALSLTSRRLLVVSNRLPVVLEKTPAGWALKGGSGGLVSALAPVLSHRGGLWIGWPGLALEKDGDWRSVIEAGFRERGYDLVPVLLGEEEVKGFYEGFANAVLWPLFHDQPSSCDFDRAFWYTYLEVNRKFAAEVITHSRDDDFIWVQDYQLIHVAEFVREDAGDRQIGFFLHIPFPPLDIFLKLPWRAQILGALLAYDLLGFQTPRDGRNFLSCLEHLVPEATVRRGHAVVHVQVGDREMKVGAFPIGIDYRGYEETALSSEVAHRVVELRQKIGPFHLIVGVDRLDYTKGLPERLQAFRNAMERYPELREKIILFQIVVPSREGV